MRYSELAKVYKSLESTTKNLEKTAIISDFIKTVPEDELEKVVLLLMGRVFPEYDSRVIGIGTQLTIKAISSATGRAEKDVTKDWKKIGDLGEVAEELTKHKKQATLFSKTLTVSQVFDTLQKIPSLEGKGSTDRKISLIKELFSSADPLSAKYITRTLLEELRVGAGKGILRDAIAKAFDVDASIVEAAWNFLPDYGEIARIAKESGAKGLQKVKLKLGIPCNVLLAEKSPDLKTALESFKNPLLQYKYDGMRIVIEKKGDKIWLFTRRLEEVTDAFPEIVEYARKGLKSKDIIIDGETLGLDLKSGKPIPFQALSTRIKRKYDIAKAMKEIPVQINIFDILYLDGENLFEKPLDERFEILKKEVSEIKGKFKIAESLETTNLKEADRFYKESLAEGHEGLIVKDLDANYIPGRSVAGGWLKVKPLLENLDLVIVGGVWGSGKRAGWISSVVLGVRDQDTGEFKEIGMMGTGIKEKKTEPEDVTFADITKMLKPLIIEEKGHSVKVKPEIVIEVSYEEIQKSPTYGSGYALRFPRFVRLRSPERSADDADTIERVERIYEMQKGRSAKCN